jgi:serine/threonine-protein kinase
MRRSLAAALVVLAASTPSIASAQNATDPAAAEALFKQARQLMAEGKYADACPKLAESQRLDPGTGTLLNLATCYEKNGQIASAWATYKSAATAAQNANELDRAKLARSRAASLEAKLPTLTIVVPAAADRPDLTVTRDGEPVGRPAWGTPIPVDPGAHAVQASAPGRKTWQGQTRVDGAGAKASIEVPALEPDAAAAPAPGATTSAPASGSTAAPAQPAPPETPSTSSPGSTQRAIGLILGGVGIVGVGIGAVFGFVAKSDNDGVGGNCNQGVCNQQGLSSLDSAHSAATVSTIAFAAGGAALAGGALLYFLAPRATSGTGLLVAPSAGPHTASLELRARW